MLRFEKRKAPRATSQTTNSTQQIETEQGAVEVLTVKNHGLVLLLSRAPVGVSPQDVPPLPAVEVELLVNKALERPRVSKRVRPLQSLQHVRDSKQTER